jgi:hypothetical protein
LGKKIKTWQLIAATGGLALGVFAIHHKYMDPPLAKKADKILMQLNPPQLSNVTPSILTGQFQNKDGNPVRIKMGKFALILNQGGKQIPMRAGLIGPYAFEFNTTIDTRGLPQGQYIVRVDDHL